MTVRPPPSLRLVTAATSLGFVVVQLDVTIVNVALPRIAESLHAGMAGLQWVVDAYALTFAAVMLSAGTFGDRWGARRTFVAGFVMFACASLGCGLAASIGMLNLSRAAQGVGAALLLPNSLALLNHATAHDPRRRAKAVAFWTAASAVSIAAGPIVGGLLVATVGWRGIFLVNLPLCVGGVIFACRVLPETVRGAEHRHFDAAGQALAIGTLTALTGTLIEMRPRGIHDPLVEAGAVATVLLGGAFFAAEARNPEPMLPLRLFRLPTFSAAVTFGTLVNLTYYGIIFVLSLYLQQVLGFSAIKAGLAFLPLTGGFVGSNLISGWAAARYGSRPPMIAGALIDAAGFFLLCTLGPHASYARMILPFFLMPAGMGLAVPAMTMAVLASVEKSRSATASAILNTARQIGGAVGVALFGALAAGGVQRIGPGLERAAFASACLLLGAAATASLVRSRHDAPA